MLTIWIIHREAHQRAALARIAGAGDNAVLGAPTDPLFDSASTPAVVMLGLVDDFELELEFVHRFAARLRGAAWILLPGASDLEETRRLFDTLPADHVPYPPNPLALRRALRTALQKRSADSLSSRHGRDALRNRFARWFADLQLPELMRAIDPRLARVPLLIRGEDGTGHTLLARYIHAFGGRGEDAFVHISCRDVVHVEDLLNQINANDTTDRQESWAIWLEDADHLSAALQRRAADWIEFGLPEGVLRASTVRWIAGAGDENDLEVDPGLDPRLAHALSGLAISIPPLRKRPSCIEPFVADTALAWCNAQGERLRSFSPDTLQLLVHYPWPGNLHELESVVLRTLSFTTSNPLLPVHLRFPDDLSSSGPGREAAATTTDSVERARREAEAALPEATILEDEADIDENIEEALSEIIDEPGAVRVQVRSDEPPQPSAIAMATDAARSIVAAPSEPPPVHDREESNLRRLVRAVAHEVRNPLVSIRTFSELLPDHYDDAEFRTHFRELVGDDVRKIDDAVSRLQNMVDLADTKSEPVDIAHLLESLLDERRDEIQSRRLLVLKELDHTQPYGLGDPLQLRDVFAGLLDRALGLVADRGDIYIASKHHGSGLAGQPAVRVLLRSTSSASDPNAASAPLSSSGASADLALVMAETVVQATGGSLTVDGEVGGECVIVIDLPAPS